MQHLRQCGSGQCAARKQAILQKQSSFHKISIFYNRYFEASQIDFLVKNMFKSAC
jgi:hypothetical protein